MMGQFDDIFGNLMELSITYGLKLVLAIVTLVVGLWLIKLLLRVLGKTFEKNKVEPTLSRFLRSLLASLLKIMLIITVISMVGVEMTSFIAILAAAGLAVGMALSGTLQNFAGGVIIILFRPFKVGDFIEAMGFMGTVKEIQIFNTILTTVDNKTIIIPNGSLSGSAMTNFSTEPKRRVDFTFGIGYSDDIDKAKRVIESVIKSDDRILKEPPPFIAVSGLGDSSVNITVRVWADAADYWGIFFDMNENVKKSFDKEGISIPFPQRDVHLYKHDSVK
jgi:small conductance mechanosensitive channel